MIKWIRKKLLGNLTFNDYQNKFIMYDISKENKETTTEISIRGRYLMMSCDIEYCLLNIICFCNPDPNNHERSGQFKGMNMGGKIQNVICDMQKYKPHYYAALKSYFDGLAEFKDVRNDMAHNKGHFEDGVDDAPFILTSVALDENNIERLQRREYSPEYIKDSLDRFSAINGALAALWMKLKIEFDQSSGTHPFVYPTSHTG